MSRPAIIKTLVKLLRDDSYKIEEKRYHYVNRWSQIDQKVRIPPLQELRFANISESEKPKLREMKMQHGMYLEAVKYGSTVVNKDSK